MSLHESNVNFRNLIRDLTDMYTYDVAEVVITELVANALDAEATTISVDYNPISRILVVSDNGVGMTSEQFRKYHDLAAGLKSRGSGIGFAGVGAKISFNIAERVITETRSTSFEGGSNWQLVRQQDGNEQLIWEDLMPEQLNGCGTRIEVDFTNRDEIPYTTPDELVSILRRHYLPLFDTSFLELYSKLGRYHNLRFSVNGQIIAPGNLSEEFKLEKAKEIYLERSSNLIGYGILGLSKNEYPIGEEVCGVLISVFGKFVKAELFNQFPGREGPRIFGLVEVPGLVKYLNTPKSDFIRPRGQHKEFEGYYGPIRDCFKSWLAEAGIQTLEIDVTVETRKIEKEIAKILEDIPELGEFFGFRSPKKVLRSDDGGNISSTEHEGIEASFPIGDGHRGKNGAPPDVGLDPGQTLVEDGKGIAKATPVSRAARRGPKITFVNAPEKLEMAWVEGNTISINNGHPVLNKIKGGYKEKRVFYFVAIGCAVQRFLATQDEKADLMFIDRLLTAWGSK
ncbi:hypothetical protein CO110_00270 [Candidatus Desantisbacteria bacterium CG_4_9_14_3_um_filter_40_11]|uniref:ATP-binding protein n=1 Tax=Candidatus Desantisbacteria bacterium CG_4_9_14_3_um_filter_40_11 TaxID=1974546 RepID=A0A2M8AWJ7_9BACT|nr:MAG: hypothetical protein CO110_00270 [Candidatus Desantisbacteria bacterium CG_4_9_14_3_um_filter_40_11]